MIHIEQLQEGVELLQKAQLTLQKYSHGKDLTVDYMIREPINNLLVITSVFATILGIRSSLYQDFIDTENNLMALRVMLSDVNGIALKAQIEKEIIEYESVICKLEDQFKNTQQQLATLGEAVKYALQNIQIVEWASQSGISGFDQFSFGVN